MFKTCVLYRFIFFIAALTFSLITVINYMVVFIYFQSLGWLLMPKNLSSMKLSYILPNCSYNISFKSVSSRKAISKLISLPGMYLLSLYFDFDDFFQFFFNSSFQSALKQDVLVPINLLFKHLLSMWQYTGIFLIFPGTLETLLLFHQIFKYLNTKYCMLKKYNSSCVHIFYLMLSFFNSLLWHFRVYKQGKSTSFPSIALKDSIDATGQTQMWRTYNATKYMEHGAKFKAIVDVYYNKDCIGKHGQYEWEGKYLYLFIFSS